MELFYKRISLSSPLAERVRPQTLEEFMGQPHLMNDTKLIKQMLKQNRIFSMILWGPPGVGKTTLARLISEKTNHLFISISAVNSGVRELKEIVEKAKENLFLYKKETILFIDELHRFNKSQQDYLLPFVESGTLILIGATTENPSFEVISPLLSRTRVLTLKRLEISDIKTILIRALQNKEKGLGHLNISLSPEALECLANAANGDARSALNALEVAAHLGLSQNKHEITPQIVEEAFQKKSLYYDKNAEEHYNLISAFIKSMRGSDPNAAIYWMCRMLEGGEDPLFIARRMTIFSSEDIGNADPHALPLAIATMQAVNFIGLPEAKIPLAQAVTYLATAPKSNAAYMALRRAEKDVSDTGNLAVPLHLRNAPTTLMKELEYGKNYQYAHDYPDAKVTQSHLPSELIGKTYYLKPPSKS